MSQLGNLTNIACTSNGHAKCRHHAVHWSSPPPSGTPQQALDLNSGVFQTVNAINLRRARLTASEHCQCLQLLNNIKLKTLEGSYSKAPLNWLELHCEHFSDWVDTIKLRTNLELNTGDRREPYQSPMCGVYYKSVSVSRLALNTTISPGLSIVTTMTLTPLPSVRLFGGLFTPHQPLYWVLSASKSFVWTPHILSFAPFSVTNRRIALDQWQPSGNLCKPTENAGSVQTTKLTHIATIHFL